MADILSTCKLLSLKQAARSFFEVVGVISLSTEVASFFFPTAQFVALGKSHGTLILGLALVIGLYRAWPQLSKSVRLNNTDVDICVKVGDLLEEQDVLVIGSNTTFDTALHDRTIDAASIQGQFTKRWFPKDEELQQQLKDGLTRTTAVRRISREEKSYGNLDEYELGTVAPVSCGEKEAYFVAISRLNEHRVASVNSEEFLDSLGRMWEGIRTRGQYKPICLPVLGSGFSRVQMSRQDLIREIVKSFIAATSEAKFTERLTLVLAIGDLRERKISFRETCEFLEYAAKFSATRPNNQRPIGTPLQ